MSWMDVCGVNIRVCMYFVCPNYVCVHLFGRWDGAQGKESRNTKMGMRYFSLFLSTFVLWCATTVFEKCALRAKKKRKKTESAIIITVSEESEVHLRTRKGGPRVKQELDHSKQHTGTGSLYVLVIVQAKVLDIGMYHRHVHAKGQYILSTCTVHLHYPPTLSTYSRILEGRGAFKCSER